MYNLNTLLDLICDRTDLHICIHDISGILRSKDLIIDPKYRTHTKPVCCAAKSTYAGFNTCIGCKDASNKDALTKRIIRSCPFGILEIVSPVMIEGKTKCLVYLGNMSRSIPDSVSTAVKTCKELNIPSGKIVSGLANAERVSEELTDIDYYEKLSDFICDFICSVYSPSDAQKGGSGDIRRHWCVEKAEEYIRSNYENNMTLCSVANLYFINEKYLGRVFKKETGKTFHEYLTDVRLEKSIQLLKNRHSVITISHMCGFMNVTYFNRCFKKKYGISPGEYRNKEL